MALLSGAFRAMSPALALSIIDPKLSFGETEAQASISQGVTVTRTDGGPLTPYDLKRLQVHAVCAYIGCCAPLLCYLLVSFVPCAVSDPHQRPCPHNRPTPTTWSTTTWSWTSSPL